MICPKCGGLTEINETHCSCGWRAKKSEKPRQSKICMFDDHGLPCGLPGILSTATNGEGPWYCRAHFAKIMGWPQYEAATDVDMSQSAVDARVNKIVPRKPGESEHDWSMRCRNYVLDFVKKQSRKQPSKKWAHRLIERAKKGEKVHPYALESALSVIPDSKTLDTP